MFRLISNVHFLVMANYITKEEEKCTSIQRFMTFKILNTIILSKNEVHLALFARILGQVIIK